MIASTKKLLTSWSLNTLKCSLIDVEKRMNPFLILDDFTFGFSMQKMIAHIKDSFILLNTLPATPKIQGFPVTPRGCCGAGS